MIALTKLWENKNGVELFTVVATGESGMSQRGLARACGKKSNTIRNLIGNLANNKAPANLLKWAKKEVVIGNSTKRGAPVNVLNIDFCKDVIGHYYSIGSATPEGCKFLGMPSLNSNNPQKLSRARPLTNKGREHKVKLQLASVLNGKVEVPTLAGNIDILTVSEVIEVKSVREWKGAIGQVLCYGFYYPSHTKRIHLFGECQASYLELVETHCNRYEVTMTWEC